MNVTKRIKLDFARSLNPVVVWVKQGDENSRFIEIVPLKNGDSYTIPSGVSIKFACKKPDGHQVLNDYPTISNNIITVPLSDQTLAAAGEGLASIILFDDVNQKILSTQNFILYIEQNPLVGSEVESSDEYQSFLAGLLKVESFPEITPEAEGKVLGVKDGEYAFVNGGNGSTEITGENYVTAYGAKGDGVTDDTAAFKSALAAERIVFVPGGAYKLSEGIVIGDNCCLELSQDTVLNFTNTDGNCITLGMLSHLKGNHATVNVPYAFSGNVVYAYSADTLEAEQNAVPPFTKWDPQWKSGRYVTDLNICKADSRGFHYAVNPDECKGTAVYLSASGTSGALTYMWGIHYTNIRIAGAFAYGIRAVNFNKGWLHEMRIDAFIDACEIGVSLEECANVYVSAIVQPRRAYSIDKVYKPYAKHGIQLIRSKNADLSGSRIWDWNATHTLWTEVGEYQHISMIGDCSGAIINDYMYHGYGDTRNRIYTDTKSNLDQITILQEPIDRWFKIRNGDPYYNDGDFDRKLVTQETLDEHFTTDLVKHFTDILPEATDSDGTIYGGVGYKNAHINGSGIIGESAYYVTTGFIPLAVGHTLYVDGMTYSTYDGYCRFNLYDSGKNLIRTISAQNVVTGNNWHIGYTAIANGFSAVVNNVVDNNNVAYIRFSVYKRNVGGNPMASIGEPIEYTVEGFLADGVKVKGENVIGNVGEVQPDWIATHTYKEGASVYDERDLIFENHNTAYLKDYGGSFNVNIGIEYDVYWDGERYTCEAKAYDDTPYLGNGSLGLYGAENTGEPFCLYGGITSADTIAYVKKDNTETETISLKVTTKGNAEYSKLPKEYLPDDIGVSIDATAEVGQTIVVKEVDENGKPTKWESAEYQPRTHWTESVRGDLVPHTAFTPVLNEAFQMLLFDLPPFDFAEGKTYTVIFDGVEYTGTAAAGVFSGTPFVSVGNTYLHGVQSTEPFIVVQIPAMNLFAVVCFTADAHTIQIIGEKTVHHKIPDEYVPKSDFLVSLRMNVTADSLILDTDFSEIIKAIEEDKNVYAKVATGTGISNDTPWTNYAYYQLVNAECRENGWGYFHFVSPIRYSDSSRAPNKFGDTIIITHYGDGVNIELPHMPTD